MFLDTVRYKKKAIGPKMLLRASPANCSRLYHRHQAGPDHPRIASGGPVQASYPGSLPNAQEPGKGFSAKWVSQHNFTLGRSRGDDLFSD